MALSAKQLERLKNITGSINKAVKNAGVTFLGNQERVELKRFTSGVQSLDDAMGGGWPLGRLVELYGSESTGKTTLCYHAIAEFQKAFPDEFIAWIDSEYSFDQTYAEKVGVVSDTIIFQQPECGEDAMNVIKHLLLNDVKLIIVDSVAALTPRAELEKDIGERTIGETARLMSSGLKILVAEASKHNSIIMFTNQQRDKIGFTGYGEKSTTPGGRALKFYASIRVELKNLGTEKEGDIPVCLKVKAICKKNKTFPPMREANYTITFGVGVDAIADYFNDAVTLNVVQKAGAWFSFNGTRIGQGKATALAYIRDNKEAYEEMKKLMAEVKASGKVKALKKPKIGPLVTQDEDEESSFSSEPEESSEESASV